MRAHQPGIPAGDRGKRAVGAGGTPGKPARSVSALYQPAPGWWPLSTGLFAAFCGAAAMTAVVVLLGGTRQQDASLAAFAALTAAIAARSVPLAAPGTGVTAWLFDNGFLVNRHAHLVWHGEADAIRLGVLLGVAIGGAAFGWAVRSGSSRVSPWPPETGEGRAIGGPRRGTVVNLGEIRDRRAAGPPGAAATRAQVPPGTTMTDQEQGSGRVGNSGQRGQLRVYLGAAAGVGKTFAMLSEGRRRQGRGTDVVVAFAETHGREFTARLLDGLEIIPRRQLSYRGSVFEEMDLDAVLARRPAVALVDELAHTNVPGSPNAKRWQDVEKLLEAGINVISTVNVQHLESLNDVVAKITGVPQRETVPDSFVRAVGQVEVVDMTAEALRRRMAHGHIYPREKIHAALSNYFRPGNLNALRELALLWVADKVDEELQKYRADHGIDDTWEARERVVVALTGGPEGETLIRRAARIAARSSRGDLLAVHVARSDGLAGADPAALARQRDLAESLGSTYHQVVGDDIPKALLAFARAQNATQLVLGASRRSWLVTLLTGPGTGWRTIRGSGDIDVHLVTHSYMGRGRGLPRRAEG